MQTNFKNDVTQPVIFNTPKTLNLTELFPTYTEDKLNKVRYIIHQCNYYSNKSGYNLDLNNHRWFLSLTRNDLSFIKRTLIEASIIKLSVKGSRGVKSDHFSMVKPFNYLNDSTVNKHFYYLNDKDCPLWVQRYVADDSACRNAKTTNWVKRSNDWHPLTVQPEIAIQPSMDKDAYIKLLELTLISNNITLPVIELTPAIPEPELLTGVCMGEAHDEPFLERIVEQLLEVAPEVKPIKEPVIEKVLSDTKEIVIGEGFGGYVIDNYSKLLNVINVLNVKDTYTLNRLMLRGLKTDITEMKNVELSGRKMDFSVDPVNRVITFCN